MRKKIVAGNWKMNLTVSESQDLIKVLHEHIYQSDLAAEVVVAPSHLSLYAVVNQLQKLNSPIQAAAQNVYYEDNGAYTGEVSTSMLKDLGLPYCIIGHSERRTLLRETDDDVNRKAIKLLENGIIPILCVGETLAEREAGQWQEIISHQCQYGLKSISFDQASSVVIAYEPIWAIGTGVSASPKEAQEVHHYIRQVLENLVSIPDKVTILYGGSVNDKNAEELFSQEDIDGGLVGGASLKPVNFTSIIQALKF